jgi:tRNA modification GTPase
LALAQRQREGGLGLLLEEVRRLIAEALAVIEAHIDFPDEDIEADSLGLIAERIDAARRIILRLIDSFRYGKVLREGVSVLLAGKPNAGKSSLLNALLREERAIVSTVPGTTRDLIEETVSINGLPVRIIDAAGIHSGQSDEVEQEGIRRTLERISEADLILFLADGSRPFDEDDRKILAALHERTFIMVVTKADLTQYQEIGSPAGCHAQVNLSAKTGQGLDLLRSQLFSYFTHDADRDCGDMVALSNVRHRDILLRTSASIARFDEHVQAGLPPELLAADLRSLLSAVGEITGATTPDAVLDLIFSSFCIGK